MYITAYSQYTICSTYENQAKKKRNKTKLRSKTLLIYLKNVSIIFKYLKQYDCLTQGIKIQLRTYNNE